MKFKNNLNELLNHINETYFIYNLKQSKDEVRLASESNLSGTIIFKIKSNNIIEIKTCLLTDNKHFEQCLELADIVKSNSLGGFNLNDKFLANCGENGYLNVDFNIIGQYRALELIFDIIGFKRK